MAKKAESTLLNMVLVLTIIAVVTSAALAILNHVTQQPIAKAKEEKTEKAIEEVLPKFASLKSAKVLLEDDKDSTNCKLAFNTTGELVGVAVESSTEKGFSGHIGVIVGFDAEGNITGYNVLETQETPGLGSKAGEWFKPVKKDADGNNLKENGKDVYDLENSHTVIGKNPGINNISVSKDNTGGEVDAITAATISSRAFCDAINRAYKAFTKVKGGTDNE